MKDLNSAAGPISNCPTSEINEKCQMLLNVFNTRRTLLPLLKAAIDNEVESTSRYRYVPLPTVSLDESPGPYVSSSYSCSALSVASSSVIHSTSPKSGMLDFCLRLSCFHF